MLFVEILNTKYFVSAEHLLSGNGYTGALFRLHSPTVGKVVFLA